MHLFSDINSDISSTLFFRNTSGPSLANEYEEKRIKIAIMYLSIFIVTGIIPIL